MQTNRMGEQNKYVFKLDLPQRHLGLEFREVLNTGDYRRRTGTEDALKPKVRQELECKHCNKAQ